MTPANEKGMEVEMAEPTSGGKWEATSDPTICKFITLKWTAERASYVSKFSLQNGVNCNYEPIWWFPTSLSDDVNFDWLLHPSGCQFKPFLY